MSESVSQSTRGGTGGASGERGSALLIVFVFAAVLAITLYTELPEVAFEAQRSREQLLIDRANEYKQGVRLFYRKFQRYPPSLDALENTNRIRFIRHRFNDPFTGKDDWRLLHMQGGILIDSKVPQQKILLPGQQTKAGVTTGFGQSSTQPHEIGGSSQADDPDAVTVAAPARRPAAVPSGPGTGEASVSAISDPRVPPDLAAQIFRDPSLPPPAATPTTNVGKTPPATAVPGATPPTNAAPATPGQGAQPQAPNSRQAAAGTAAATPPGAAAPDASAQTGPDDQRLLTQIRSDISNNGVGTSANRPATQAVRPPLATGAANATGLAGVASKSKGKSIKIVNDQTDYAKWEFYYDPQQDTRQVSAGGGAGAPRTPSGQTPVQRTSPASSFGTPSPAPPPPAAQAADQPRSGSALTPDE